MRKVIYTEWVMGELSEVTNTVINYGRYIEKEGLFHGFFPTAIENNDGSFGNFTDALIETEDGRIVSVDPSFIRFVDKPETEQLAEFAKAAMQGILSNESWVNNARIADDFDEFKSRVATASCELAKSMIAELNKQK